MDKLFAIIQKTSLAQKLAAIGLLIVLLVGGYYYYFYLDQVDKLSKLDAELSKLEDELQEKQAIAANLSAFKKRVEYLEQKLEEKKKNLPDDANMDQLLKTLNELSEKSDIRINSFTPLPEAAQQFYAEIPVALNIMGNYHEVATFFDKVSREDRIINISNIGMKSPDLKSGKIVLQVGCLAKTFRALPEMSQSQPPAK